MELNREQIIKALECCTYGGDFNKSQVEVCSPCPYFNDGNCTDVLKENALSLINELTKGNARLRIACDAWIDEAENARAENARLTEENDMDIGKDLQKAYDEGYADSKVDTLRELQIRLTRDVGTYLSISIIKVADMFKLIDQIAEEMIGGADDKKD